MTPISLLPLDGGGWVGVTLEKRGDSSGEITPPLSLPPIERRGLIGRKERKE